MYLAGSLRELWNEQGTSKRLRQERNQAVQDRNDFLKERNASRQERDAAVARAVDAENRLGGMESPVGGVPLTQAPPLNFSNARNTQFPIPELPVLPPPQVDHQPRIHDDEPFASIPNVELLPDSWWQQSTQKHELQIAQANIHLSWRISTVPLMALCKAVIHRFAMNLV